MRPACWSLALLLGIAGCAVPPPPPDTAHLPPGSFGQALSPDVVAINQAEWAFASSARTRGRPIEAARAIAGLDYMAGALSTNPRYAYVSPIAKTEMLQARVAVRAALGIAPEASSQVVVTRLLAAADALAAGDAAQAARALAPPVFQPDMLERLANIPYVQVANVATTLAAGEVQKGPGGEDG